MATAAHANFAQPYTPAGSAPSTAGDRAASSGRGAANPMASPRLKHVKGNLSSAPDSTAAPQAPARPQPLGGVDVHDLLNEMDNHNQNMQAHKRSGAGHKLVSPSARSREPSPPFSQRPSASPTASVSHNLSHTHNYHQLKLERDMLHDRCQQLQQQVRSLQLAYKESATRRVQEEQAFREILKSERERFDRHVARFHAKVDERDTLLSEWVKAIYERNAHDAKVEGRVENIPELQQASPNVKDLRNTFSLLSARSAALVPGARQYLTPDDIDRANSASRDEALARRRRKVRSGKKKGSKKKQGTKKGATATDAEDEDDEEDPDDPIGAFRPMPVARTTGGSGKTSSASPVLRKKVGGRVPRSSNDDKPPRRSGHGSNNNNNDEEEDDDNSTVTGSIMDIDERADALALDDTLRGRLSMDRHDARLDDGLNDDEDEEPQRPGSQNQADARKEDADRILQELVDALSLEEQLSDQELTSSNLQKHNSKPKGAGNSSSTAAASAAGVEGPAIVTEASREIEDFLALTKQEQETDRILAEFLQQHNTMQQKHAPSTTLKTGTAGSHPTRSSMSAGTNATFSELNFTPMSTASTASKQQPLSKQVSVTGKSMEEYVRTMKTAHGAEHTGMFDGLHGVDDSRDLEQQLQDILQSVSDITKSFASNEDSAILAATAAAMASSAPTATTTLTSSGKFASPTKKPSVSTTGESLLGASSGSAKKVRVPTEEDEQAAKIYELLQYATESIEEADALAGYERQHQPPVDVDESLVGASAKKKKKRGSKSVSIQLSPEEELRQIVQDTVKSTAEVTSGSTKQGQVAHATRDLQNVVLRSSMDLSTQSASVKQATAAASSSSTKQTGNKSRVASINASSAAALSSTAAGVAAASSVASNSSSKAQQMVETYLGASSNDALALMGRASNAATPVSSASSKAAPLRQGSISSGQKPPEAAANKGGAVGQEGSLTSDNKYWWDISVSGSVEAGSTRPGASGTGGGASAAIGGDSLSDSLKLGGELDQH